MSDVIEKYERAQKQAVADFDDLGVYGSAGEMYSVIKKLLAEIENEPRGLSCNELDDWSGADQLSEHEELRRTIFDEFDEPERLSKRDDIMSVVSARKLKRILTAFGEPKRDKDVKRWERRRELIEKPWKRLP